VSEIELRPADDYEDLSRIGAAAIADVIRATPDARILIATGRTPVGAYWALASMVERGELDVAAITAFQLDEYVGLEPGDGRSLGRWAHEMFVGPLRLSEDRFVALPLDGEDALAEYDRRVRAGGGYDLAILGIGENGHLGFNEPPCDASAPSRVVSLSPASITSNARYWGDRAEVPLRAATVGLGPILESRSILVLASGDRKREVLERALLGPETSDVPASHLQRAASVVVVADRDAWTRETDGGAS
jgi:glucosamine-6-phosphate deaminase